MTGQQTHSTLTDRLNVSLLAAHVGINSPHFRNSRFYNFPRDFEGLFSTLVSHADNHEQHRSALSPAAYFVDLIRFLKEHIDEDTDNQKWLPRNDDLKDKNVRDLAMTPDGRTVFVSTENEGVFRSNVEDGPGARWRELAGLSPSIRVGPLAMAPDGETLFGGTYASGVFRCAIGSSSWARHVRSSGTQLKNVETMAALNRRNLFVGTSDGRVFRGGTTPSARWRPLGNLPEEVVSVNSLVVTSDGRTIFAGTLRGGVCCCNLEKNDDKWLQLERGLPETNFGKAVFSLSLAPDGRTLFAGTAGAGVFHCRVKDCQEQDGQNASWKQLKELPNGTFVQALAATPDGGTLFAGTRGSGVFCCNIQDGQPEWRRFNRGIADKCVTSLAVTPDGGTLLAATQDGVFSVTLPAKLKHRRPDIWEIPLDRAHTQEQAPFLEIVNNVLTTHLGGVADGDEDKLDEAEKQRRRKRLAREMLATAPYPFDAPFHMPLLQIRTYLAHLGVELTDVYETLRTATRADALPGSGHEPWVAEVLGLTPLELARLTEEPTSESRAEAYGLPAIAPNSRGGLDDVATFLDRTGLTPDEFGELLQLEVGDVKSNPKPKQPSVACSDVGQGEDDAKQSIENLDSTVLDDWNRLIRLSKRMGWSFHDLGCALCAVDADLAELALLKKLSEKYKLPVDVLCSFIHPMNTSVVGSVGKPARKSLFDRVFNSPPFYRPGEKAEAEYHPQGAGYLQSETVAQAWDSTSQDKENQGIRGSLLASLGVTDDELQAIVNHLSDEGLFADANQKLIEADKKFLVPKEIPLDVPGMTRLYRFSKMARVLGMRVQDYLLLLTSIQGKDAHRLKAPEVATLEDLRTVGYWADWLRTAGLSPYQLYYLTKGERIGRARRDFDPYAALDGWLFTAQTFAQGAISPKEAADVHDSLLQAEITALVSPDASDSRAFVKSGARVTCRQVIDALALDTRSPAGADDREQGGKNADTAGTSLRDQLRQKDTAAHLPRVVGSDGQIRFDNLLKDPEAKSQLAEVADLLGKIRTITDTLNRSLTHPDSPLVIRALDYLNVRRQSTAESVADSRLGEAARLVCLAKVLDLSADEFDAVLRNPTLFGFDLPSQLHFDLDTIRGVHEFSELVKAFDKHDAPAEDTAANIAALASQWSGNDDDVAKLSALSDWDKGQVSVLRSHLGEGDADCRISRLATMKACFELAAKLGVDVGLLIHLSTLPVQQDAQGAKDAFDGYSHAAQRLLGVVKSKYSEDKWGETFGPIRDHLNERERDALAAYVLHRLRNKYPEKRFGTLRDLSEFLLIDVEMSGCVRTSYVKEAIGCLQIYIERCRMHIEEDATLSREIPDSLWSWMGHYRMWEANRKVFFYPENYLEPSQRKQATPLFKELQSELLQGDITDEAVTDAYINYFDKLDELASLRIVDGHAAALKNPQTGEVEWTLFVIGRTSCDPPIFYQRSAILDRKQPRFTSWRPWEKIELTIPVDSVTASYDLNRIYIYWLEKTRTRKTTKQEDDGTLHTTHVTKVTVKYSYQKVSGRWLQPQIHPDCHDVEVTGKDARLTPFSVQIPCGQPTSELLVEKNLSTRLDWRAAVSDIRSDIKTLDQTTDGSVPFIHTQAWQQTGLKGKNVHALTMTPDDRVLFAGTSQGVFRCDIEDGPSLCWRQLKAGLGDSHVQALAMTSDGQTLFAGTWGYGVYRCNVGGQGGEWLPVKGLKYTYVFALALTPDGQTLFTASVISGADQKGVFHCNVHDESVEWRQIKASSSTSADTLAMAPNGRSLFVSGRQWTGRSYWGGEVCFCDIENGPSDEWDRKESLWGVRTLAVKPDPDGGTLFAGTTKGVFRWQEPKWVQLMSGSKVSALTITSDGRTLLAGTASGVLRSQVKDGQSVSQVEGEQNVQWLDIGFRGEKFGDLAVTRDGQTLFVGTEGHGVFRSPSRPVTVSTDNDRFCVAWTFPAEQDPLSAEQDSGTTHTYRRLTTHAVHALRQTLVTGGLDKLLSLPSQSTPDPDQRQGVTTRVGASQPGDQAFNTDELLEFDLGSPFALYFREIFFHIPFLIADALQRNQQFEHARKWYQYILDPTQPDEQVKLTGAVEAKSETSWTVAGQEVIVDDDDVIGDVQVGQRVQVEATVRPDRSYVARKVELVKAQRQPEKGSSVLLVESVDGGMWRYRPFRGHTIQKLTDALHDPAHQDELIKDAFDPHAIAQTRLGAYEKAVAMKYLDNLIDWGDMLFAQDSWEAINQATVLYVQALNLLGPKVKPQRVSISENGQGHRVDDVTSHVHEPKRPDLQDIFAKAKGVGDSHRQSFKDPFFDVPTFFCLPENDQFASYWNTAENRLYKIRHCMNIKGTVRQLALFQPPIDPRQLIRAMAAGQDLGSAPPRIAHAVPHYRFSFMMQQARNVTGTVIQLGAALLSALEKKDAEQLNLLRSTHEQSILKMTRAVKDEEIKEGAKHLASLRHSLDNAQHRQTHYTDLIEGGYSSAETADLALEAFALYQQLSAVYLTGASIPGFLVPVIYGFSDGGMKPGDAANAAAQIPQTAAAAAQQGAGLSAAIAQFQRRKEDWQLQQVLAGCDVQQIQAEIEGAEIRQTIFERERELHEKSTQQARERDDFFRGKFNNQDLYQWMAGRLSTVYSQTYTLAFDLAQAAERAYQYERNTDATFIDFGYWDNLKKGLLAGEGLMLGLNQLEKAHTDHNERPLEIEKTISLAKLNRNQLEKLQNGRSCKFKLNERLFDSDFPGHYCRKIKSIAISIPAVVGPYQNVQAILRQELNRVLLKHDIEGVNTLIGKSDGATATASIRYNWRPLQAIAISKGVNDSGMFELDFRDERYLPFEGTGAVSDWNFEMPAETNGIDLKSISDVIIHLKYTALDGPKSFKDDVRKLMSEPVPSLEEKGENA